MASAGGFYYNWGNILTFSMAQIDHMLLRAQQPIYLMQELNVMQ